MAAAIAMSVPHPPRRDSRCRYLPTRHSNVAGARRPWA